MGTDPGDPLAPKDDAAAGLQSLALQRDAARLRRDASVARADSLRSAKALMDVEAQLAVERARAAALEQASGELAQELQALSERLSRADDVTRAMQRSPSWRITAPLRALKRLI